MNLHLMLDEKIISHTICCFEQALPHQNVFVVLMEKGQVSPKYVNIEGDNIKKVEYGTKQFWNAVGLVESYAHIIIHHLNGYSVDFINKIKHNDITWIIWGADLYGGLLRPKGYKLFYDEKLANSLITPSASLKKRLIIWLKRKLYYRKAIKAVSKLKHICSSKDDMKLLLLYYPEYKSISRLDFFYYPLDAILSKDLLSIKELGNDIIVGNSASVYGNHQEVFEQLSHLDLEGRKVKVPLSYGSKNVVKYVTEVGENLLKDKFKPITEFMPLDKYNQFLSSARTYIYGNYRQEAFGNLLVALYMGGSVFLHPSNTLLNYFREMGCVIFSTDDLNDKIDYKLSMKEKENNQKKLMEAFNKDRLYILIQKNFS